MSIWKVPVWEADKEPQHKAHLPKHGNCRTNCSATLAFTRASESLLVTNSSARLFTGSTDQALSELLIQGATLTFLVSIFMLSDACHQVGRCTLPRQRFQANKHQLAALECKQRCLLSALFPDWPACCGEVFLSSVLHLPQRHTSTGQAQKARDVSWCCQGPTAWAGTSTTTQKADELLRWAAAPCHGGQQLFALFPEILALAANMCENCVGRILKHLASGLR